MTRLKFRKTTRDDNWGRLMMQPCSNDLISTFKLTLKHPQMEKGSKVSSAPEEWNYLLSGSRHTSGKL